MKRLVIATVLAVAAASAHTQSEWINIAASNEIKWDVQPGSLEFSQTKGGTAIAVVIGRTTNTKTSRINLYK